MFQRLSELAVRIADLAEAEGRELRRVVQRLGLGFSLTLVAAGLALAGGLLILAAVWIGLKPPVGEAWASAITGVLALVFSGLLVWLAVKLSR